MVVECDDAVSVVLCLLLESCDHTVVVSFKFAKVTALVTMGYHDGEQKSVSDKNPASKVSAGWAVYPHRQQHRPGNFLLGYTCKVCKRTSRFFQDWLLMSPLP